MNVIQSILSQFTKMQLTDYLDIALVTALLGFVSTVFVGRYIERRM